MPILMPIPKSHDSCLKRSRACIPAYTSVLVFVLQSYETVVCLLNSYPELYSTHSVVKKDAKLPLVLEFTGKK